MTDRHDVAIIGAGHHGLVAALRLARRGRRVAVLERGTEPGGCIWTERHPSGVVFDRGAVEHGGIVSVAEQFGLCSEGVDDQLVRYRRHPIVAGCVFADGERRAFHVDAEHTASGLADDADRYRELAALARSLFDVIDGFPAPPTPTQIAAALAGLEAGDELFRMILQPAERVLAAWLTDPHTRGALAVHAAHAQVPAWSPGTGLFALLVPATHGQWPARPIGGSRALVDALMLALHRAGAQVRTGAEVVALHPAAPACGTFRAELELADGSAISAGAVISTLGAGRTAQLAGGAAPELDAVAGSLHSGLFNVGELTLSLVLERAPTVELEDPDAVWYLVPSPEDIGRTFAEVAAGQLPTAPWAMFARVLQPPGTPGDALWLSSIVPLRPASGPWTVDLEHRAADRVLRTASEVLGVDLSDGLVDRVITGPRAWAERIGGDGNPNHLDLTIDQLLGWRPPGHADGRTELDWLFLAGAGQHPGGGLSGSSGLAAADAVLSDRRPRRAAGAAARELRGLIRAGRSYLTMRRASTRVRTGTAPRPGGAGVSGARSPSRRAQ